MSRLHRTNEFHKEVLTSSLRTFIIYLVLTTIIYLISGDGTFLERVYTANSTAFSFLWLVVLMSYLILNRRYKRRFERNLTRKTFTTFKGNIVEKIETENTKKAGLSLSNKFHYLYEYINVIKSNGNKGVYVMSGEDVLFEKNPYKNSNSLLVQIVEVLVKNGVEYEIEFGFCFDEWEIIIVN